MKEISQETITGTIKKYLKSRIITLDNSGKTPVIKFFAGVESEYPDGHKTNQSIGIWEIGYKPGEKFKLYHPQTGEEIGTFTSDEVITLMYSLFKNEALKRGYE